jgi:hypothetical protein
MSKELLMQFVGFSSKDTVREYTFTVREPANEPREFTLTIANEAFTSHRISFQDAPGVCSLKLRREFATNGNNPAATHFHISDLDLEDYRSSHSPRPRSPFARKPVEEY